MRTTAIVIAIVVTMGIAVVNAKGSSLPSLLRKVAGVYQDPPLDVNTVFQLNNTVVVTAANHGYLNHVFNFDCFMKRLKMKYLVMALDRAAYDVLSLQTNIPAYYVKHTEDISSESVNFQTIQFNQLSMRKIESTLLIMKLGYDILFSDPDVAILRDPLPFLLWNHVDYVHSFGSECSK